MVAMQSELEEFANFPDPRNKDAATSVGKLRDTEAY